MGQRLTNYQQHLSQVYFPANALPSELNGLGIVMHQSLHIIHQQDMFCVDYPVNDILSEPKMSGIVTNHSPQMRQQHMPRVGYRVNATQAELKVSGIVIDHCFHIIRKASINRMTK